jgi:hypothetical protein
MPGYGIAELIDQTANGQKHKSLLNEAHTYLLI